MYATYIHLHLSYYDLVATLRNLAVGALHPNKDHQIGWKTNGEAELACLQSGAAMRIATKRAAAAVATLKILRAARRSWCRRTSFGCAVPAAAELAAAEQ